MPYHKSDTYFDNHKFDTDKFCVSFVDVMRDVTSLSAETKNLGHGLFRVSSFGNFFGRNSLRKVRTVIYLHIL